jgi:hypothetical protein
VAYGDVVAGNFIIASELAEVLPTPWSAYVPTWSSSGTQPVLNNGTLAGIYTTIGKIVTCSFELIAGSSTTYGTGEWRFTVPVAASSFAMHAGAAWLYDDGTAANRRSGVVRFLNSTTLLVYAQAGEVTATQPFTWATADRLRATITYDIA